MSLSLTGGYLALYYSSKTSSNVWNAGIIRNIDKMVVGFAIYFGILLVMDTVHFTNVWAIFAWWGVGYFIQGYLMFQPLPFIFEKLKLVPKDEAERDPKGTSFINEGEDNDDV